MPGQGRLHRDLHRLGVADLTDHDHVRILPQDGPQQGRKGQPDLGFDLDLVDAPQLVFDRIFDRDDVAGDGVQAGEAGV